MIFKSDLKSHILPSPDCINDVMIVIDIYIEDQQPPCGNVIDKQAGPSPPA